MSYGAGELGHLISIVFFVVLIIWTIYMAKSFKKKEKEKNFLLGFSIIAILFWLYMQVWYLLPENYDPFKSFPLHVCDLLLPIGIIGINIKNRWIKATTFYWSIGFATQAFITPTVYEGPNTMRYWLFWISHSIIIFNSVYLLIVHKYKGSYKDAIKASLSAIIYLIIILPINLLNDWNYGYVGNMPSEKPSIIDLLGPWPLRILWMFLIMVLLFMLITIPFIILDNINKKKKSKAAL